MRDIFRKFANSTSAAVGSPWAFILAVMVFLIQNTQNRDAVAIHLKLDELLRAVEGARTGLVDLESMSDEELQQLQEAFQRLRKQENEQIEEICEEVAEEQTEREVAHTTGGSPPAAVGSAAVNGSKGVGR
jgi:low affinity Fe/Cu permease